MLVLLGLLRPVETFNNVTGALAKRISLVALALMVVVILVQVFFRYVLNNALPWPDEAARFLMLWLTGLMAPVALRQGSFVAIDTLIYALPSKVGSVLTLILLCISLLVFVVAVQLGWNHVNSGWLFSSSSLKLPLQLIGMKAIKIKLAWAYLSLFVGVVLMIIVNIELILRELVVLLNGKDRLRPLPILSTSGAE